VSGMSVLKEKRCYGLSGGNRSGGHVSVIHVKLTDSAARAIEDGKVGYCFRKAVL